MKKRNTCGLLIMAALFFWGTAGFSDVFDGETNGIKNKELIRLARGYLFTSPAIYYEGKQITSLNTDLLAKIKFEPAWFLAHPPENIGYANDQFVVYWRFMPGCEQRPDDKVSKPNWFNAQGYRCLGGYAVSVIIDSNSQGQRVNIFALD